MVDLDLYFSPDPAAQLIPLDRLHPVRARPEGIHNAAIRMDEAAAGLRAKRPPITVRLRPDGDYDVLDGNSTYAVARERGWEFLPCLVAPPEPQ